MPRTQKIFRSILLLTCLVTAARLRAEGLVPPPAPSTIAAPEGNRAFLVEHAVGTQNYLCLPRTSGIGLAWTFIGPQATLFDDDLDQKLTHFLSVNPAEGIARATWQHSQDSSAVWALAVATSTDPAYVTPGAIPWLLLRVVGAAPGPNAGDRMTETTFIQRVNTVQGAAPAGDCPSIGARAFVPYAADYVFYRAK